MTPEPDALAGSLDRGPSVVGVAIVSWNVRELLLRCLESLGAGAKVEGRRAARVAGKPGTRADFEASVPLEIIVVDNASADGSAEAVRAAFPRVTIVENAVNLGFTAGNNQAFRALGLRLGDRETGRLAGSAGLGDRQTGRSPGSGDDSTSPRRPPPFVFILNPDTEVGGDALATLIRHLAAHPNAGAVGPLLRFPDGSTQSSRRRFPTVLTALFEGSPAEWWWPNNPWARRYRMEDVPLDVEGEVDWLNGAAILFRSEALAEVGGFDESFFMYSEELDLCRRLRAAGWSIRFEPAAEVIHHEGRSSGQVAPERHRLFTASRVLYQRKAHGRLAGLVARVGLMVEHAIALGIEAAKWVVGHRRSLRAERMRLYADVMVDLATGRQVPAPGDPQRDRFDG